MTQARQPIHDIFSSWQPPGNGSWSGMDVLERVVPLLAPMRADATQVSVDTRVPSQLRLTLNPFADRSFGEVRKDELMSVLHALACPPLEERALRLYRLGYALPDQFWLGVAPTSAGCVVKAYVASAEPILRTWLPRLARDAGWLPPLMQPSFLALYERLVPALGRVEGIGISFCGNSWVGTTLYLRSCLAWPAYASDALATLLDLSPTGALARLPELFPETPPAFGWSLECDADGALVELKAEVGVRGPYSQVRVADYAEQLGIDTHAFDKLSDAISTAGLWKGHPPAPAVLSLRFLDSTLRSLVGYFPVEPRPAP